MKLDLTRCKKFKCAYVNTEYRKNESCCDLVYTHNQCAIWFSGEFLSITEVPEKCPYFLEYVLENQ